MSKTFSQAINEATTELLQDPRTHVIGLGATYPNGLDGTMSDLAKCFPKQVHDTPCSEAAVTGMAVGMATNGLRPIVHHGRIEFAFYAFDQILTQAAKWNYMFGGDNPCPLTMRIAMGRQWGNGPQHTFTNKGVFAVPGLKVVAPSSPYAAKYLLVKAHHDMNPVVYLESRWLYKTQQSMSTIVGRVISLDKATVLRPGTDVTIIAVADMVLESLRAAKILQEYGISAEVIDLVSIYPLDLRALIDSYQKTRCVVVVDASTPSYGVASEIGSKLPGTFKLTCPDTPCPTAPSLTAEYYPTDRRIASYILGLKGIPHTISTEYEYDHAKMNLPPTDDFGDL